MKQLDYILIQYITIFLSIMSNFKKASSYMIPTNSAKCLVYDNLLKKIS
jgi:hypothetical protein